MSVVILIIAVVWGIRISGNVLSFVHLWFVKEYRLDRMLIHLGTEQGKRLYILPFRKPPLSPKAIALVAGSFIVLTFIFLSLPYNSFVKLLIVDILSFPVTLVFVLLFKIPTTVYHTILIQQAISKLRSHKPMIVIGITGSYGKTSTKEYLATILRTKYKVLKTEASKNSPIGIAEAVLSSLRPDHEIFVVEMGAYKKGEIAHISKMVQPEIGIITAVNAQHQDLFKTIENTMKAKYELIQGLTGKKIAILNTNNAYVKKMASWARRDKYTIWPLWEQKNISGDLKGITFDLKSAHVSVLVLGEHQSINITLAIMGAVAAGMNFADAARAARLIQPLPNVLSLIPGINGSNYINDTFNNNPDAAKAALKVLAKTKRKKILVFQAMIELGSYTNSAHHEVAQMADKICDEIILTNNNFYDFFVSGIKNKNKVHIFGPKEAATFLRRRLRKGDTVLFKGKEAENVLKTLV